MIADQLRYFKAAAKHEHLGRAAEELGMSQPALSRAIIRLEDELGVSLFDRAGRGVRLNAFGRILLRRVENAFAELEDARRELAERGALKANTVSIGFLATLGVRTIPALVQKFRENDPEVRFQLLQGSFPKLREYLLQGVIDICIASPRFADANIEWRPLYCEELFLLAPTSHRFAKRESIDLSEAAEESFVALKKPYGLRSILDELCEKAGFQPTIAFESEEVSTLRGLVGAGLGVTIVPKRIQNSELAVSIKINSTDAKRIVGMSWRRGRFMPEKAIAFRDFVAGEYRRGAALE